MNKRAVRAALMKSTVENTRMTEEEYNGFFEMCKTMDGMENLMRTVESLARKSIAERLGIDLEKTPSVLDDDIESRKDKNPIGNELQIIQYLHCRCIENRPKGTSPQDYRRYDTGMTDIGIQVWCCRCQRNICHIDFEGQKHPADMTSPRKKQQSGNN